MLLSGLCNEVFVFLQMYIPLEGVGEDNVDAEFKPMALDVKIHQVQGKNYRCAIPKLHGEIVPEKCKVLVKPKRIVITMVKSSRGNWLDIHHKEDKVTTQEHPSCNAKRWSLVKVVIMLFVVCSD